MKQFGIHGNSRGCRSDRESVTETSTCQGNNLNVAIDGVAKASGETLRATMIVNMTAEGNMYDSYIGTMGASPIHFEEVCQRVR